MGRILRILPWLAAASMAIGVTACADPDKERIKQTTQATYDQKTGKLTELTYDRNKNGKIDTWTEMDGARPVRSRSDLDEDGKIDRWEYYDDKGNLAKVGFSRKHDGRADAWAFSGPDGKVERIEISSTSDEKKIDRWEHYENGILVRAEEDTNGDGRPDKWETYENGAVKTASMDENGDGKPDRRLTYAGGALVLIESEPDATGVYHKSVQVK
jgi:antitoxin component YwqK of YwqJK toxin-antitoxin module